MGLWENFLQKFSNIFSKTSLLEGFGDFFDFRNSSESITPVSN
jgi:hypothetical protein